jgi:hypothetical protein
VGSEELTADLLARQLPGDVLDPVLAKVEAQAAGFIRPRATRAVKPPSSWFINEQRTKTVDRLARPLQHMSDALRRAPPSGRMMVDVARAPPLETGPRPTAGPPGTAASIR